MFKEIEKHFRFEFKYVLDPVTYMKVKDFVESVGLYHDQNVDEDTYTVTSLYFDTHGIDDYYDKSGGFLKRKKVRARIYEPEILENTKKIHLEVKHKHDMYIRKQRTDVSVRAWKDFINGKSDKLLDEFGLEIVKEGRRPSFIVRYEREAFVEPFLSRVRLTFDKNIEVISHDNLEYPKQELYDTIPVSGSNIIMEIKFNQALPWWFGFMVQKFELRRSAYSKYANSMDKVYRYNSLPR